MTLTTTPWDPAAHLKTAEDVAAYLAACEKAAGDDAVFMDHARAIAERALERIRADRQ